jgi:aminoglycoside/choline kinase family phosphotransferase
MSPLDEELKSKTTAFIQREYYFYTEISTVSSIRSPICYYGDFSEDSGDSILLLEDLGKGQIGNIISGGTIEAAQIAVDELAKLHAAWWEKASLRVMKWLPPMPDLEDPEARDCLGDLFTKHWTLFQGRFEDAIPETLRKAWDVYVHEFHNIRMQSNKPPLTLCHGDYHLENISLSGSGQDARATVFDWQCLRVSQGPLDICYFLVLNLDPDLRRKCEPEILARYCDRLVEAGVTAYTFDECYHAYKVSLYELLLARMVGAGALLNTSSERAQELFRTIIYRTTEAIKDYPIQNLN